MHHSCLGGDSHGTKFGSWHVSGQITELANNSQQMYPVGQRGPDPVAGDTQGYRHEEADADAEGEREDFGQ